MNLLQMTQRLYRETGKSGNEPTTLVGASRIVQRLADALADSWLSLQQDPGKNWKWMRATGTGNTTPSQTAHSPADLGVTSFTRWRPANHNYAVKAYRLDNPTVLWPLIWLEREAFDYRVVDGAMAEGQPRFWSIDSADNLLIGPGGDEPYGLKFEYVTAPTELALDADTPGMPERHHLTLVWRALVDAGKDAASPDKVSRALDRLRETNANLIDDQAEPVTMHFLPLC